MSHLKILISGAGIGGGVFASWLLRAYPQARITFVERAPALRLTGASVDIRSSAVDIIKAMGVEQEIRDHSTKEAGVQFVREDGSEISSFGATGRTDIQSITSEYEIFRGALARIFLAPVLERVKFVFNDHVKSYDQDKDKVNVQFAGDTPADSFDLLIAADGFGSRIRGMMLGTDSRRQIRDEGVHVAYFTMKNDLLKGSRLAQWYNATKGRVVFLRPDPSGRTRGHFINVTTRGDNATKASLNEALRGGNEAYMTMLENTFQDAGWLTPEVLEGMRDSDDFYCSLFAQVRSPTLHDGRVVLLGDAGYATPGFGTSLAIAGGYVLAGELLRNPDNHGAALEKYEQLMLPFAKGVQGDDQMMQYMNPQTAWGITVRNAIMRIVTGLRLDKMGMYAASKFGFTEKKLAMPDYDWPGQK